MTRLSIARGGAEPYTISGIFDRAYTQEVEPLDDGSTINTTKPVLGVRDSQFRAPPKQGTGYWSASLVGCRSIRSLPLRMFNLIATGTKLILNKVKS